MKLSAIITTEGFAGVVPTEQVQDICKKAGITEYTEVTRVRVSKEFDKDAELVYEASAYETIDDLEGGQGRFVYK